MATPRPISATLRDQATGEPLPGAVASFRAIDLLVDEAELQARREQWEPLPPRYTRGVLAKFAKLCSSASEGAVTDKNL